MALAALKKILSNKKPSKVKTRVLTAEGWKRRFSKKLVKAKKSAKR